MFYKLKEKHMLRVLSLFSGIGAFEKALSNLHVDYELVNYCEIDPYASKAYSMIHKVSEDLNLRDVTTIDTSKLHDIDLMTWGFPCTDISVAGKQKGFEDSEGNRTRSGLFFEGLRILQDVQPKYSIVENVKALTSKKFVKEYMTVLNELSKAGYNNYVEILNAKDFGVPQNRERVFIVSIRKDIDDHNFFFPQPMPLLIRLKDVLEQKVDEKFYLKSERADKLIESLVQTYSPNISGENKIMALGHLGVGGQKGWVFDVNGISRCLAATDYKDPTKVMLVPPGINSSEDLPKKIEEPHVDRLGNLYDENAGGARAGNVYNASGLSPTLQTAQGGNRMPLITEPIIAASRGRNPDNPSDRTTGLPTEQRLEVNTQGISNTLTTVGKDNYVVEPKIIDDTLGFEKEARIYEDTAPTLRSSRSGLKVTDAKFRIRKLTPRECWRLMGFNDEDFDSVKGISNTQLYKMAGNSIVVNVLQAIFANLLEVDHD